MAEVKHKEVGADMKPEASQFLTFNLAVEEFAVPIMKVKEIIEYRDLKHVPLVPDFISGAINLRGSVVPVVNLSVKLGFPASEINRRTCIVIMEIEIDEEFTVIGILVDKVLQVQDISDGMIEPPPTLGTQIRTDFIRGMGRLDERIVIILDIERVLSAAEIAVLGDLQDESVGEIDSYTVAMD